jgi:hypothetical protein
MGIAAVFNRTLHGELNTYAAWFPVANTFKLGDYGLISDGVFTPMGNIAEYKVEFSDDEGPPTSLDFTSSGTNVVRLAGGAEVDALPDAPIDAKLSIEFSNANSILAKAAEIKVRQMQNVNEVARNLAKARGWERKFRVVWGTYTGEGCAVVTTRANNAKLELSGQANALKLFELGKVEAGLTISHEHEVGFKSLGKSGVIGLHLFKLRRWFGGPELLGEDEQVEIDDEVPEELEDDV